MEGLAFRAPSVPGSVGRSRGASPARRALRNRSAAAAFLLVGLSLVGACRREKSGPSRIESDQLRAPAQWLTQEPVALLRGYVRIDTSAARGERAGAEFLARIFECAGIQSEIVCPSPGRCNLLARLPGRRRHGALLLLNHIDVAEADPALWKDAPPFEGTIKNGYLYGRGVYDMKSIAIAQALAMRGLKARGVVPPADVLFLAEADEESRQLWGSRWLLENRSEWFTGVRNVLNEGGVNEMILRDIRFWGIETVQAGYGVLELEAAEPGPLAAFAARWKKIPGTPVTALPVVVEGFGMLANHLGHPLTDPLRHLDRVRGDPAELAKLPDRYGSFLEPRIYWSPAYRAADGPTGFRAFAVISTPPGVSPNPLLKALEAEALRGGLRTRSEFSSGATVESPYPTPFTELLKRVTEVWFPGIPFGPVPTYGGITTSVHFRSRGFPSYGYSPIAMNITDSSRRHGNDERIFLADYVNGVRLYEDLVLEYAAGR